MIRSAVVVEVGFVVSIVAGMINGTVVSPLSVVCESLVCDLVSSAGFLFSSSTLSRDGTKTVVADDSVDVTVCSVAELSVPLPLASLLLVSFLVLNIG